MAQRCPFAEWKPLGPQTEPRMTSHDIVCVHTMVGYVTSTDRFFREVNGEGYAGTESHYGIGGKWGPDLGGGLDGKIWQWQDRTFEADANLNGRGRVISVETADNAERPIQPWTAPQLDALVRLISWECSPAAHTQCPESWLCHQVGIPKTIIPDTKQGRRGVGYHKQGCDPYRVAGGELWSTAYGKDCPTQARIDQLAGVVVPRVQTGEELDMGAVEDILAGVERITQAKFDYIRTNDLTPLKAAVAAVPGQVRDLYTGADSSWRNVDAVAALYWLDKALEDPATLDTTGWTEHQKAVVKRVHDKLTALANSSPS